MTTYLRFPDEMVLVTEEHDITEPVEFQLKLEGIIFEPVIVKDVVFWKLVPNLSKVEFSISPVDLSDLMDVESVKVE
jgi:hypothetical protein